MTAPAPTTEIALLGLGHHLPDRRVTSAELAEQFRGDDGETRITGSQLRRLTGITERRYAAAGESSSDLAAAAGTKALASAGMTADAIDLVIFASASHDLAEPATANRVQALLGCDRARVMDVKNACNSFLDGLDVARAMVSSNTVERVLVVNGEVISPFVRMHEDQTYGLNQLIAGLTLGDAGAAAVVGRSTETALGSVGRGHFQSFGQHWDACRLRAGGNMSGLDFSEAFFVSDSHRLFSLAIEHVPVVVKAALHDQGWAPDDVDLVIPHQASTSVTRSICRATGIPFDRCVITGDLLGNTAAASIPVALSIAHETGRLADAKRVLLIGGAAGFSAAALPLHRFE